MRLFRCKQHSGGFCDVQAASWQGSCPSHPTSCCAAACAKVNMAVTDQGLSKDGKSTRFGVDDNRDVCPNLRLLKRSKPEALGPYSL